jgi:hypothetical protein
MSAYTGNQLCADLKTNERCFRSARYVEGKIYQKLHEHVPAHRISQDGSMEVLRTLVGHASDWPEIYVLHSRLNKRSGSPFAYPGFLCDVSYPEPGVVRYTVSSTNAWAWFDTVVIRDSFRSAELRVTTP